MTRTESQFDGFFRGVYPRVLRSSHLLLGDRAAAEDVAQEAFARLLGAGCAGCVTFSGGATAFGRTTTLC